MAANGTFGSTTPRNSSSRTPRNAADTPRSGRGLNTPRDEKNDTTGGVSAVSSGLQ
eukprot:gene20264-7298_t